MIIYQHWYDYRITVTLFDLVFVVLFVLLVFLYTQYITQLKFPKYTYYRYFAPGLMAKVLGSIAFAFISILFYPGDNMEYFRSVFSLNKLMLYNFEGYLKIMLEGNAHSEYFSFFNQETGYPTYYMWRDHNAVFVWRVYSVIFLFTSNSFLISTIVASLVGFSGLWKLYQLFCRLYPGIDKYFAYGILFFPSIIYWSGGILKEPIIISAMGWMIYSFYYFAIKKKYKLKYLIAIIIAAFLIINIKAYIFVATLPGLFIWLFFYQIKAIKSPVIKFMIGPILVVVIVSLGIAIYSFTAKYLGDYGDIHSLIYRAQITQQDLIREESYGSNYFDIGRYEPTIPGILSKFPIATISGIFRPFLWEARNPFILLAALESAFLFSLLVCVIYKNGIKLFIQKIMADPVLIFSLTFVILFSFGVGLSTANFGALVRYKIPMLPFYTVAMFVLLKRPKLNEI